MKSMEKKDLKKKTNSKIKFYADMGNIYAQQLLIESDWKNLTIEQKLDRLAKFCGLEV